jgi:hypothetical protein
MAISKRFIEGVIGAGLGVTGGAAAAHKLYKPKTPRIIINEYGRQQKRSLTPGEKQQRKKRTIISGAVGAAAAAAAIPLAVKGKLGILARREPEAMKKYLGDLLPKFRKESDLYRDQLAKGIRHKNDRLQRLATKRLKAVDAGISKLKALQDPAASKALVERNVSARRARLFGRGDGRKKIVGRELGMGGRKMRDVFKAFQDKIERDIPSGRFV